MGIKNWFKKILAGIGIGVGAAIPGISGGTIAVILNIYEKITWAVANIFKKFKEAIIILIPVLIGVVIGLIPTWLLMEYALNNFLFGVVCIFAGFIIGSFPEITKQVKDVCPKKAHIITLVISFVIALALGVASILLDVYSGFNVSQLFENPQWWLFIILIPVGFLASSALVIPGISGSMILVLIGFYKPLIDSIQLFKDPSKIGTEFGILICFGIGVIIGFYLISKLMNNLLNKHREVTFFGIIGFIIGSLFALFLNSTIWQYYQTWSNGGQGFIPCQIEIPLGIVLLIIVMVGSYFLMKLVDKK